MASVQISCRAQDSLPCDKARHILLVLPDSTEVAVAAAIPDTGPRRGRVSDVKLLLGQCERVRLFLPDQNANREHAEARLP